MNGGLFRGLPFPDAGRVVSVVATRLSQNQPRQNVMVHDLDVWITRRTSFEKIGGCPDGTGQ